MNYKALFINRNTLRGECFTCSLYCPNSAVKFLRKNHYPVLFVLSGSLTLFCEGKEHALQAGHMVIADRKQITGGFCLSDTILLEYTLPKALTVRFGRFQKPMLSSIPITGRLEAWVEDCLLQTPCGVVGECEQLIDMLVRYQSRRLKSVCDAMRFYLAEKSSQCRDRTYLLNYENSLL